MNLNENPELKEISERIKSGMLDYISDGDIGETYTKEDVLKCMSILNTYLNQMNSATDKSEAMKYVEKTVLELNELNNDCEEELIETDQREDISEFIILAGHLKGYNNRDEDITEEWREW